MTEPRKPLEDWLTTSEAAELVGVEQITVRMAIYRERLRAVEKSNGYLVRREDVVALWPPKAEPEPVG